jgi:hypothetical protein
MTGNDNIVDGFAYNRVSPFAGTPFILGIPPYGGVRQVPQVYQAKQGVQNTIASQNYLANANWLGSGNNSIKTRINKILYSNNNTAHRLTILQPLNFCYSTVAVAKGYQNFTLDKDPGVFSTNYRYPLPNGQTAPACVIDNPIGVGHYVAYQLIDGTWVFDTVASGSGTAIALTTPVPNCTGPGGTVAGGAFFFFGGVPTYGSGSVGSFSGSGETTESIYPATGQPPWSIVVPASSTPQTAYDGNTLGLFFANHPGDPLIVYSANTTSQGTFDLVAGYYANNP